MSTNISVPQTICRRVHGKKKKKKNVLKTKRFSAFVRTLTTDRSEHSHATTLSGVLAILKSRAPLDVSRVKSSVDPVIIPQIEAAISFRITDKMKFRPTSPRSRNANRKGLIYYAANSSCGKPYASAAVVTDQLEKRSF